MYKDWLLSPTNKFSPNASMSIDRLALYIDKEQLKRFHSSDPGGELKPQEQKFINGFSQILAHEAYHVYQTLSCRMMSDYSVSKRREALVALRIIQEVAEAGNVIQQSSAGLSDILEHPFDNRSAEYFKFITSDREKALRELNSSNHEDNITGRQIIEGAAVAFQLLSQDDIFNTTVDLDSPIYTKTWSLFVDTHSISTKNKDEMKFYRTVFLYLSDVYLKSLNHPSFNQESFSDSVKMMTDILELKSTLWDLFDDAKLREYKFLYALTNLQKSDVSTETVIDFCGTLDELDQRELFFHVCLYGEVFNRIAPVGFPFASRTWLKNNKQQSINQAMKSTFPYWQTDFVIPCILSSSAEVSKFIDLWGTIDECHFIDDTRNSRVSVIEENTLLQLYDDLAEQAFFPSSEGYKVNCCGKHGFLTMLGASNCTEIDSLNSRFYKLTKKHLNEVIENV